MISYGKFCFLFFYDTFNRWSLPKLPHMLFFVREEPFYPSRYLKLNSWTKQVQNKVREVFTLMKPVKREFRRPSGRLLSFWSLHLYDRVTWERDDSRFFRQCRRLLSPETPRFPTVLNDDIDLTVHKVF